MSLGRRVSEYTAETVVARCHSAEAEADPPASLALEPPIDEPLGTLPLLAPSAPLPSAEAFSVASDLRSSSPEYESSASDERLVPPCPNTHPAEQTATAVEARIQASVFMTGPDCMRRAIVVSPYSLEKFAALETERQLEMGTFATEATALT